MFLILLFCCTYKIIVNYFHLNNYYFHSPQSGIGFQKNNVECRDTTTPRFIKGHNNNLDHIQLVFCCSREILFAVVFTRTGGSRAPLKKEILRESVAADSSIHSGSPESPSALYSTHKRSQVFQINCGHLYFFESFMFLYCFFHIFFVWCFDFFYVQISPISLFKYFRIGNRLMKRVD